MTIDKIYGINIWKLCASAVESGRIKKTALAHKIIMIKNIPTEILLLEILGLAIKYIPASRIMELATKYVPMPSQEEFETSKLLTTQEQNKWDRKYWNAWNIQRIKERLLE